MASNAKTSASFNKLNVPVSCIIDAHVHSPILNSVGEANEYLRNLLSYGLGGAVILGIPAFRDILAEVSMDDVANEYGRSKDLIEKLAGEISDRLTPEYLYLTAWRFSEGFCRFMRHSQISMLSNFALLYPVNLSLNLNALRDDLEKALSLGFSGFKVISTLFMKKLDDPAIDVVLEVAEDRDVPVTIHSGCDFGIWELPRFCKYGDPSKLDKLLSAHRGARVVLAHAGSYSAIAPGVFMEEALEIVREHANVHVDTSALPPSIVRLVLRDFPADRVMFGSDYPAVEDSNLTKYMEEVFSELKGAGHSMKELEMYAHENAERLFSVECSFFNA